MGTVITFYSYKGGVGRTFAMANIAALLAMNGKKILCIDWDLEAPGLEFYFEQYYSNDKSREGIVELITALKENPEEDWRNYCIPVQWNKPFIGNFDFIPAGNQDETYTARMQDLNWENLYKDNQIGEKLERLREEWVKSYDYILIDSRAGVTDIGGICTIQMPDILFTFATANKQSIDGTITVINKILNARSEMVYPRAYLNSVPVLTRVDRNERDLQKKWEDIFVKETEDIYGEWLQIGAESGDLLKRVYIPYYPFYSYGEELPVTEENPRTENINIYFENLAALIIHGLADTNDFINDRDKYVAEALRITKAIEPYINPNTSISTSNDTGNIESSYLDLLLEGKEIFTSIIDNFELITNSQDAINKLIHKLNQELNIVANSQPSNRFASSKNLMDKIASEFDFHLDRMYKFIVFIDSELESALKYYRKGYSLLSQAPYQSPQEREETIYLRLSFVSFKDNLNLLQKNIETFNNNFIKIRPTSKAFNEVQKKGISFISNIVSIADSLVNKSEDFIKFLESKI